MCLNPWEISKWNLHASLTATNKCVRDGDALATNIATLLADIQKVQAEKRTTRKVSSKNTIFRAQREGG